MTKVDAQKTAALIPLEVANATSPHSHDESAPSVTIGIPVFNCRATLERAIDSALSQTYRGKYEIILVDDGSDDNSPNIARAYSLRFPSIVRYFALPHRGVAATRNSIVKRARGEYMTWLDADDYYFPTKIEQQVAALQRAEAANAANKRLIVFSRYRAGRAKISYGAFLSDTLKYVLNGEFRAYLWASMTRTTTYRKIGPFNEALQRSEDQDWLIRLLLNRGRIIEDKGKPVMEYHFSTNRNGRHVEESLDYIVTNYGNLMKEKGIYNEFVPRRYWEVAAFYSKNRAWDDMWRARGMALKLDFDRFFPRLIGELVSEMKDRDRNLKTEMEKYVDDRLAGHFINDQALDMP